MVTKSYDSHEGEMKTVSLAALKVQNCVKVPNTRLCMQIRAYDRHVCPMARIVLQILFTLPVCNKSFERGFSSLCLLVDINYKLEQTYSHGSSAHL